MKIICLSDTHGYTRDLAVPDGDLLIHAGDLTSRGTEGQLSAACDWLRSLPHRHKVVIAGNHDFLCEKCPDEARALFHGLTYLLDEGVEIEGLTIWGSPWQPWFHDWAFNLQRGPDLAAKWNLIPTEVDILVTHGPPLGHGDRVRGGERVGCADLLEAVKRVRPKLHVFGHIHEDAGTSWVGPTRCVNACVCDLSYLPIQPPVVVDWEA